MPRKPKPLHFVPWDEPGRFKARALCGLYVDRTRDTHPQEPTCPTCAELLAQREIATRQIVEDLLP